jgi:hypothetical protein
VVSHDSYDRGAGKVGFAAIMFLVIGFWNIFEGILAFFRSSFWTDSGAHYVLGDLRTWASIVTIWGVIEIFAAISISQGGQWGRWFGIIVAGLAILLQMWFLPAYPFWGLIAIGIYLLVIWTLVVYGGKRSTA